MMRLTRLGWDKTDALLEQRGNGRRILELQTTPPRLEMERTVPRLRIDQSGSFADAGLRGNAALLADHVAFARRAMAQGIARVASDGNQMIDIHSGVDAIAAQADYNAFGMFEKEFGYGTMPSTPPRIEVDPGTITYRFIPGRVENRTQNTGVSFTYHSHSMTFYTK